MSYRKKQNQKAALLKKKPPFNFGIKNVPSKQTAQKKSLSFRTKMIFFQALVITCLLIIGWIFYQYNDQKIKEANKYIKQIEILKKEQQRCHHLVNQGSGNFDDYQYCRQLLQKF